MAPIIGTASTQPEERVDGHCKVLYQLLNWQQYDNVSPVRPVHGKATIVKNSASGNEFFESELKVEEDYTTLFSSTVVGQLQSIHGQPFISGFTKEPSEDASKEEKLEFLKLIFDLIL